MKPTIPSRSAVLALALLASPAVFAQETPAPAPAPAEAAANPAADLGAAVEKLAAATSYTWTQTSSFGNMEPRTTTGKKGAGGYLFLTIPGRDQDMQVLVRKGKAAMKGEEGWVSATTAGGGGGEGRGPGRFLARMMQNRPEPTAEVKDLVAKLTDLKAEGGSFRATLNEETAKGLMTSGFGGGRRGGGGGGNFTPPEISGAGGSVTFTVSNGALTGYELVLTGKMSFNGEEREMNRTTKYTFSSVGSTSFDIPEAAAGLLAE